MTFYRTLFFTNILNEKTQKNRRKCGFSQEYIWWPGFLTKGYDRTCTESLFSTFTKFVLLKFDNLFYKWWSNAVGDAIRDVRSVHCVCSFIRRTITFRSYASTSIMSLWKTLFYYYFLFIITLFLLFPTYTLCFPILISLEMFVMIYYSTYIKLCS